MTFQSRRNSANEDLRLVYALLLSVPLLLASACNGGSTNTGGGGGNTQTTVTSVSVSCASASVTVELTDQCSANVLGTNNPSQAVNWSVNSTADGNSTIGIISSSGLYTAPDPIPSSGSTITIMATSQADSSKSNSAPVSLTYPTPSLGSVSPATAFVGSANTALALAGSGFSKASTVNLDGLSLTPSFVATSQLNAVLPAASETVAGNHTITVSNPTPGGATVCLCQVEARIWGE